MAAGEHPVDGHVRVQPGEDLLCAGGGAPVPHQVADDAKKGDDVDAGAHHLIIGEVADLFCDGARGFLVGPDGVPLCAERASQEGGADVCDDAGEDDLLLACGLDRGAELGGVPGVYFSLAGDDGGGGVHVEDFLGEGAVGAGGGRGGEDYGEGGEGKA